MTDTEQKDIIYLLDEINNAFQNDIKYALLLYQTIFDILYENNYLDDKNKEYVSNIKSTIMREIMIGKEHNILKPVPELKSKYISYICTRLSYTKDKIGAKDHLGIVTGMMLLAYNLRTYEVCIDTLT